MNAFLVGVAVFVALLIGLGLIRIARGPTIFDRAVSASMVAANGVVILVLVGFIFDRIDMFVDIAIAYSLLTFILPVGFAAYFEREEPK